MYDLHSLHCTLNVSISILYLHKGQYIILLLRLNPAAKDDTNPSGEINGYFAISSLEMD